MPTPGGAGEPTPPVPAVGCAVYVDFSTRERGIAQYTSAVHAIDGLRSVSARAAPLLFIGRRALPRSQGEHAPVTRSGVGWTFRLGTRWASGQSEGAGWRAGTHPRLRQQGPEPARRGGQRQEEEQASGGAGSEAIDRQVRGATTFGEDFRLALFLCGVSPLFTHDLCPFAPPTF